MIYFIGILALVLGFVIFIAVLMRTFEVQKRQMLSPVLISIAPILNLVPAFLLLISSSPDPQSGFLALPSLSSIFLINIVCSFLMSYIVVSLYRIKPHPYILISTLLVGLIPPAIALLSLIIDSELWIVFALFTWPLLFSGYTAYYLYTHDLPSDNVGESTENI
jgi:hypothetical protein